VRSQKRRQDRRTPNWLSGLGLAGRRARGAMNGFANALIGATAADVAGHEIVDIGIGGIGLFGEQCDGGHDLAGLAVPALRDVFGDPGFLNGMEMTVGGEAFNGGDFLPGDGGNGGLARARGFAINVHGASAAEAGAAAKFGSSFVEGVAEHPKERHVWADVDRLRLSVEDKRGSHRSSWR